MGRVSSQTEVNERPRTLIIVQNLPVPFDRRVRLECRALTAAGYDVTVVCPKGKGDPGARSDGVRVDTGRMRRAAGLGSSEYAYSFLATARWCFGSPHRQV